MRIVIVDDHLAVAEAIGAELAKHFEVAGILTDGNALPDWFVDNQADIVLMDTTLPVCNIQDVIRRVCRLRSDVKVVAMSIHVDESDWRGLHRFGAHGVVSKIRPLAELVESVVRIASTDRPLVNETMEESLAPTARQLDVLRKMAADLLLKEVATELRLSLPRADELVGEMKARLNVRTTVGLVLRAVERGWIEPRIAPRDLPPVG
jgi:DNA-binding NarL/FixJ family response regulator